MPLVVLVVEPQCFHLQWPPDEVEVLPVLELLVLELDELELLLDDELDVLELPEDELDELELPDELPLLDPLEPVDPQCFLQW